MKYDSVSFIECMKGAEDEEILKLAVKERRVIVTNDKDFGRLAGFFKPVCKRVIEAQGGTIRFESKEGKGTKFIIDLPSSTNT